MSINGGILEFDFDDDDIEESYYDNDYEESTILRKPARRNFYAKRPPAYYRRGPAKHGTITAPGGNPVPVNFGDKFATSAQMESSLNKVQNDILIMAEAIKKLETAGKNALGGFNPLMLLLMQQKTPQIQSIAFANDPNSTNPVKGMTVPVTTTTYVEEKDNLLLILALSMIQGGGNDMNQMLPLILIATKGGL